MAVDPQMISWPGVVTSLFCCSTLFYLIYSSLFLLKSRKQRCS